MSKSTQEVQMEQHPSSRQLSITGCITTTYTDPRLHPPHQGRAHKCSAYESTPSSVTAPSQVLKVLLF